MDSRQKKMLWRILAAGALFLIALLIPVQGAFRLLLFLFSFQFPVHTSS